MEDGRDGEEGGEDEEDSESEAGCITSDDGRRESVFLECVEDKVA